MLSTPIDMASPFEAAMQDAATFHRQATAAAAKFDFVMSLDRMWLYRLIENCKKA